MAQNVEQNLESEVEETVEQSVEADVESSVESSVEVAVEDNVEQAVEASAEVQVADAVEERLENEIDDILDGLESELEVDEERIHREQWLVMAEPEVFEELTEQGYLFDTVTDLPGLGMRLAEVAGPSSFDITEVRRGVLDVVGKDRAEVDLNHIYTAGSEVAVLEEGVAPRAAIGMPTPASDTAPRIGMIDSSVDVAHPALYRGKYREPVFRLTRGGAARLSWHSHRTRSLLRMTASTRALCPMHRFMRRPCLSRTRNAAKSPRP